MEVQVLMQHAGRARGTYLERLGLLEQVVSDVL